MVKRRQDRAHVAHPSASWCDSQPFCSLFPLCLCQVRNKLNTEHSGRLQQNKELLSKRNTEVTMMDKRIGDLRERLHKKKTEARQKEINPTGRNSQIEYLWEASISRPFFYFTFI